jgi:hypothetical protein
MKSLVASGAVIIAVMIGLAGCVLPPPPPPLPAAPPPVPYVAPAPIPPPPYAAYRRCGPGWHWVRAHRNPRGRWIPGHCQRHW